VATREEVKVSVSNATAVGTMQVTRRAFEK